MPTPMIFDPEPLLAPISEDEPAGKRPSILELNKLKEYREDFDPERDLSAEDRRNPGLAERTRVVPQWNKIVHFGQDYFTNTGKDLTVAVRVTEALTRSSGFAGLRDGIRFLRRLCEDCWDRMFPVIEDVSDPDELEGRIAPFAFIDDEINSPRFPNAVRAVPFFATAEGVDVSFANCQVHDSGSEAVVPQEAFRAAVTAASMDQIDTIRVISEDLAEAFEELQSLTALLDSKAGSVAPSFGGLKKALEDCRSMASEILRLRGGGAPVGTEGDNGTESTEGSPTRSGGGTALGSVRSREDVYARLNELTLMLEQFDPHSPVPFLIRRAIELRDLRFPQLVDTLASGKPVMDFLRAPIQDESAG